MIKIKKHGKITITAHVDMPPEIWIENFSFHNEQGLLVTDSASHDCVIKSLRWAVECLEKEIAAQQIDKDSYEQKINQSMNHRVTAKDTTEVIITPENAQEHASIIGQPLADIISNQKDFNETAGRFKIVAASNKTITIDTE